MEDKLRELGFVDDAVVGLQKLINNYKVWVFPPSGELHIIDKTKRCNDIIHEQNGATFKEIILAILKHCSYNLLDGTECDIKVGDVVKRPRAPSSHYTVDSFFIAYDSLRVKYNCGGWTFLTNLELVTPKVKSVKLTKTKRINNLEDEVKQLTQRIIALESSGTQTDPDELKQGDWAEVLESDNNIKVGTIVLVAFNIDSDGEFLCHEKNKKGKSTTIYDHYFKPHQLKRINK